MLKNKIFFVILFSFTLVSFCTTTRAETNRDQATTISNTLSEVVRALDDSNITYNSRTQTIRIYPNLHYMGTALLGIVLLGLGLSVGAGSTHTDLFATLLGYSVAGFGISRIRKATQVADLSYKPVVIINSNGITYQGEAFDDGKAKYLAWTDVEKIIERLNEGRDLGIQAKSSPKSIFIPVEKSPISYEALSKIVELYFWLATTAAEEKAKAAQEATATTPITSSNK